MTRRALILKNGVAALVAVCILSFASVSSVDAAFLLFDPDVSTIGVDETFDVDVNIDAGTDQIAGTDIRITFDSTLVSLQSVTGGDYFPMVSNIPSTGALYIAAHIVNQGEYKTGTGTVATLVFKALKEGAGDIKFTCDLTQTETSKINKNDLNASNIINCSALNPLKVTVSAATTTPTKAAGSSSSGSSSDLPESGVLDSMISYAGYGIVLVGLGLGLRLLSRVG
ncbi:hypothetical protein KBD81_01735 [Candidatus Woesebacteria bacterium]|nr:hypothetical protein [Candidatus Woesebacteria bacterium]